MTKLQRVVACISLCMAVACSNDESGGAGSGGAHAASGGAGSSGSGAQGGGGGQALACGGAAKHSGEATYYTFADGSGNCSFDPTPQDLMVGAMNHTDYQASAACGACATLQGPQGQVTVRIVDRCPECPQGDIDLSPEAFAKIADISKGRVPISWQYVPCSVSGPVVYRFKEGSNQWWTAVQVRNHKHAIAKLEYEQSPGKFVAVAREDYNYFVEPSGMGPGPYTFRVTDVYGHTLTDSGIAHKEAAEVPGSAQFPNCGG
ncbi:MAG: expansin EXLX1 family cellulose-binding protein [Polyangiaceae bacterium]